MALVTSLRTGAALPSLLVVVVACSTGKPPADDGWAVGGSTSGSTSGTSGSGGSAATATGGSSATGQGGSSATGQGGASAMGGASASSATGGTDPAGGTGGDTATGGVSGTSATGGASATGGDAGTAGVGGAAATGGDAGTAGTAGTDPGVCQELSVVPSPQIPTVELLVDTSSSMWDMPQAWPVLYDALMVGGPIEALQSKIRFGFASYKGHLGTSETDAACATMTTVDPALDNFAAIKTKYDEVGASYNPSSPPSPKWETPTGYAITYASTQLQAYMPDPPGKKFILLVTDGNPNTCTALDPQCGEDYSIKAAQTAFAAGIGLFALGVGDLVKNPNNGCPTSARCGNLHLQDLANAGIGAAVMPPNGCEDPASTSCQLRYEACNNADGMLLATYTAAAPDVGTPFSVDTAATDARAKLLTALTSLLSDAISCTVEMDAIVTGDPSLGVVAVGGMSETYMDANGWMLEADKFSVTLQGDACTNFKSGQDLHISFPCDPNGNPIAVHR